MGRGKNLCLAWQMPVSGKRPGSLHCFVRSMDTHCIHTPYRAVYSKEAVSMKSSFESDSEDFLKPTTVQNYFHFWRKIGLFAQISHVLVMAARESRGRPRGQRLTLSLNDWKFALVGISGNRASAGVFIQRCAAMIAGPCH